MGLSVGVGHARSVKDATAPELARAVRSVLKGERVLDPVGALTAVSEGENPLTPREREACKRRRWRCSPARARPSRGRRDAETDQELMRLSVQLLVEQYDIAKIAFDACTNRP